MIQVFPDATLVPSLLRLVGANLYYWPYTNSLTLGTATVLTDFTIGASTGFSVPVANFTLQAVTSHIGKITAPDQSFVNSTGSPDVVYGYFVTDATSHSGPSGNLVMCAQFDSPPITIAPSGGFVNITPTIALEQLS
jgi:hypothetical protein